MAVLVDSSVWIAAADSRNKECLALKRLIQENEVIHIVEPIRTEVCQGARSESEFHKLWDAFMGFDFLEITERHWELSAWNYFRCRKKGLTLGTLDCLVATLAQDYRVPLWSLDHAFVKAKTIIGFELR